MNEKTTIGCPTPTPEAALELYRSTDAPALYALADAIRREHFGNTIETCSILNARSGRCPENCTWCAQSAQFATTVKEHPFVSVDEAVREARATEAAGVQRFSLVTSGRVLCDDDVDTACRCYEAIRKDPQLARLRLCGSFGLLGQAALKRLQNAGMTRYHCNLETAPSCFSRYCTTHTAAEKIETLRAVKSLGLELCSGGIIGMGETPAERIEMAFVLREIGADSIPVNVLQPIAGTPLQNQPPLSLEDIFRTFALFRIINPFAQIRFAAGRALFASQIKTALSCGVNAAIVGDLLTTLGSNIREDFETFSKFGYQVGSP